MIDHNEIWKDVVGFEGLYQVSTLGRVKSLERRARNGCGTRRVRERILKPGLMWKSKNTNKKYRIVGLAKEGTVVMQLISTLMLTAFVGPRPLGGQALHWNDISTDDRLINLYWGNIKDNAQDAIRNGRIKHGQDNYQASATNDIVRKIRRLYATGNYKQVDLARKFKRSSVWIHNVVHYKKWKYT